MIAEAVENPAEKRSALQKALGSRALARSEQLRLFLSYVCEAEMGGTTASLNEYVIGVEVLHRPRNYSPAEDSSVRTRAYELRQKLEKLYAEELKDEPVHIVIPKGAYTPQFLRVTSVTEPLQTTAHPTLDLVQKAPELPKHSRGGAAALAVLALLLGVAATSFFDRQLGSGSRADPLVHEAWSAVASRNDSVLLMAATPLYLVLGPKTHGAFGTPIYPAPLEAYSLFKQHRPLASDAKLGMIFTNDAMGVGNLNAIVIASNVVRELGATPQILPERPAMMSVLHGRNAILFGAPVDSQVISDVLEQTPFSVVYDPGVREFVIRDRTTGRGIVSEKRPDGDFVSVYGLVTVLNNRDSDRGPLGMIVFSGITSVGTHGAAEYFSSPHSLKALRSIFAKEGVHGFPLAYQVVVKCRFENMLLVGGEYYTHRILQKE
jgi:hypothetical protein